MKVIFFHFVTVNQIKGKGWLGKIILMWFCVVTWMIEAAEREGGGAWLKGAVGISTGLRGRFANKWDNGEEALYSELLDWFKLKGIEHSSL